MPDPGKVQVGQIIVKGTKTGSLAFSVPTADVPVNKWIHFRMEVQYTKYDPNADAVLHTGKLKVSMDDKSLCDYSNINIGKNDELGPYFKFGIYKPSKGGFSVDDCGYTETIKK